MTLYVKRGSQFIDAYVWAALSMHYVLHLKLVGMKKSKTEQCSFGVAEDWKAFVQMTGHNNDWWKPTVLL